MNQVLKKPQITIKLDRYINDLNNKLNGDFTALKVSLNSLDEGSFTSQSKMIRDTSRIAVSFPVINTAKQYEQECNKCFRAMVQSVMDFFDIMIAIENVIKNKIKIENQMALNDFFIFLDKKIKEEIQKVSKAKITYEDKVKTFNLNKFSENALISYIDLRHSLEHRKNIPTNDIKVTFVHLSVFANNKKIKKNPSIVSTGNISSKITKHQKTFKAGQEIKIDEVLIENINLTLQTYIIPKMIKKITPRQKRKHAI